MKLNVPEGVSPKLVDDLYEIQRKMHILLNNHTVSPLH